MTLYRFQVMRTRIEIAHVAIQARTFDEAKKVAEQAEGALNARLEIHDESGPLQFREFSTNYTVSRNNS